MPHLTVHHDEAGQSYRLLRDGDVVAIADYRRLARQAGDDVRVFHHTYTRPDERGNGYAERLVRAALDDVRAAGARLVATCWFVAEFLEDHPEYGDLRA